MDFVSIRIITGDVARLVDFYENATGVQANWSDEDFAELRTTRPPSRSAAPAPSPCSRPAPPARPTTTA